MEKLEDCGFGYVVIECFLESFMKENIQLKLTDIPHLKTQGSLDHMSKNGIIEHSISYDYLVPHNGNDTSDQVDFLEDAIIKYSFELLSEEGVFSCKNDDG